MIASWAFEKFPSDVDEAERAIRIYLRCGVDYIQGKKKTAGLVMEAAEISIALEIC
jgi:hypothetical protein